MWIKSEGTEICYFIFILKMKKLLILIWLSFWLLALTWCNRWPSEPYVIENPTDNFQEYSQTWLDAALATWDNVVVYFWASRCPWCMALKKDIIAKSDTIPDWITILAADFDNSEELKTKYEVTKKHTTVYLTPDGTVAVKNTNKEHSLEDILAGVEWL